MEAGLLVGKILLLWELLEALLEVEVLETLYADWVDVIDVRGLIFVLQALAGILLTFTGFSAF